MLGGERWQAFYRCSFHIKGGAYEPGAMGWVAGCTREVRGERVRG